MPSNLPDTDAVEISSAQAQLGTVRAIKPKDASRDVRVKHPVILMDDSLPLIVSLKAIRRIQKNEAQSWGLARSRAARR
jgi:hypothetical protein